MTPLTIAISANEKSIAYQLKYVTSDKKIFKNILKGTEQLGKAPSDFSKVVELELPNLKYYDFVANKREFSLLENIKNGIYPKDIKIRLKFQGGMIKEY